MTPATPAEIIEALQQANERLRQRRLESEPLFKRFRRKLRGIRFWSRLGRDLELDYLARIAKGQNSFTRALDALPSISGQMPRPCGGVTVCCGCDPVYFRRYVPMLADSIALNDDSACLHVHVIGDMSPADREIADVMRSLLGEARVSFTWEAPPELQIRSSRRARIYQAWRVVRLSQIADACRSAILAVDCDVLITRPLRELEPYWRDCDAAVMFGVGRISDRITRIAGGAFYVSGSQAARAWLRDAAAMILFYIDHLGHTPHLDERSLGTTLGNQANIAIGLLPDDRVLVTDETTAFIYTGRSTNKEIGLPIVHDKIRKRLRMRDTTRL